MLCISSQETRRLFGPSNRPDFNTNVRHRALLRKALELVPPEQLAEVFHQDPTKFMRNYRLVSYETPPPDLEARQALREYRNAYNAYFMSRGNNYAIRNPASKSALQAAEQTWHDWIVPYLAARGMPGRPDWALQPLLGLQSVRVAPAHAPTSTPPARRHRARLSLPTPPPSSPAPVLIDLSRVDDPPTPPARKRKFLGEIEISDDEDDADVRPRKKVKFLGYIDLTH